ncbi:hypothetical protein GNF76_25335 [Pseudomonas sp. CCM 7893]|uniref:Uncharacterized protein n=1 Tax=Pseudomonas spelaei TaxID=1055469 RepID=A0A6I3WK41_9PSED|nr:hypothetical protein [Pseudomonas spelaei]MUF07683.1 hypothetical protein [Pseudomonas spelaei]
MSAQQKKHPFDFKTQYGLGFNPLDDEIVVDFFCGGGRAGRRLIEAANIVLATDSRGPVLTVLKRKQA